MSAREVNFDGLIGPTHNYAGLSAGNLASAKNANLTSRPRDAALEGLEKMRTLLRLGYTQGFLPPQQRPRLDILTRLGFSGSPAEMIEQAYQQEPRLLAMVYSASAMWAANAATVTPSPDSQDGRVHFTPANLLTTAHRSFEHTETEQTLATIFANQQHFAVHSALHSHERFADEGAANHTRLCDHYGNTGVGLFVYGRDEQTRVSPQQFPARQTLAASQAIARQHQVKNAVFLRQNPAAIDAGAFHNDVVAVGNGSVLFFHQDAFLAEDLQYATEQLRRTLPDFQPIDVPRNRVSLDDAIQSYLFNSQLLAAPDGDMNAMRLIAPMECRENPAVHRYLSELTAQGQTPIRSVSYVNVRQSMSNGGGPACLRLRVVLTDAELAAVDHRFILDNEAKIDRLQTWVNAYYQETLAPEDLRDPQLILDSEKALHALPEYLMD